MVKKLISYCISFVVNCSFCEANCGDRLVNYDSDDELNVISDNQRFHVLYDILNDCPQYKVGVLQRLGLVYFKNNRVDSALVFYQEALNHVKLNKQYSYLNSVLVNIGNLYISLGQYKNAFKYYMFDTSIRLSTLSNLDIANYYYNRSNIYSSLGNYKMALYDLVQVKKYSDLNDLNELVSIKLLEIQLYRRMNNLKQANLISEWLFSKRNDVKNKEYKYRIYSNYSFLRSLINKSLENINYADTALIFGYGLKNDQQLYDVIQDLVKVYEINGEYKKSFELLKNYQNYQDSIKRNNVLASIQLAEFNIQNELNTKNLKLSKATLELRNNQLIMMGVGLVLVVALTLGGWRYFNQKQKLNKQAIIIKENEKRSLIQEQDMKFLLAQMKGQIDERRRIAADLHNTMGNRLASIKLKFENLEEQGSNSKDFKESIRLLNSQIDQACIKLREISHEHYDRTWMHELRNRLEQVNETHNIKATLIDNGINLSDFPAVEVCLFTISEGLISNTIRHSQATEITIQLIDVDNELSYSYEDNGRGFDKAILSSTDGIGYRIIKEKVEELNGTWDLDTVPGSGMTLFINIPLLS